MLIERWERLKTTFVFVEIWDVGGKYGVGRRDRGEESGNPLQYSCLENPVDSLAWWAAIYGVTQSWTRLK